MISEDLKALPFAAIGAARGVGEVYLKPAAVNFVAWIGHIISPHYIEPDIPAASITFYSTGEDQDDRADLPEVRPGN